MKYVLLSVLITAASAVLGGTATLLVEAPEYAGQAVILYRYDDLITLRTVRIGVSATTPSATQNARNRRTARRSPCT